MAGIIHRDRSGNGDCVARLGRLVLFAVVAMACQPPEPAPRPSNLLLISIDTLRADFLGCYGYPRETSPHLDALAAEGVLFEQASTTAPWTLPAHGSLLTGRYPSRHGATSKDRGLSPEVGLLAEALRARGFRTSAIVNSRWLHARFGFDRGFDDFVFLEPILDPTRTGKIVDEAIAWLSAHESEATADPFFLFVHDFQAHSRYAALPEFREGLVRPYDGPVDGTTKQLRKVRKGELTLSAADLEHLRDLYASGIRQADHDLGRLLHALEASGLAASTLVIVASDHGEAFMEHGDVLHGRSQFEELLRVPLVMRGPDVPRGMRIPVPVSVVDVMPTALSLLVGATPERSDGVDLSRLWRGEADSELRDRVLFGEADHNNRDDDIKRAARSGRYKLHLDRSTQAIALYDLTDDPGETVDRQATEPDTVARLRAALGTFAEGAVRGPPLPDLDPRHEEQLRALGYLDDPVASDPKTPAADTP